MFLGLRRGRTDDEAVRIDGVGDREISGRECADAGHRRAVVDEAAAAAVGQRGIAGDEAGTIDRDGFRGGAAQGADVAQRARLVDEGADRAGAITEPSGHLSGIVDIDGDGIAVRRTQVLQRPARAGVVQEGVEPGVARSVRIADDLPDRVDTQPERIAAERTEVAQRLAVVPERVRLAARRGRPARDLAAVADHIAFGRGAAERAQVVQRAVIQEGVRDAAGRRGPARDVAARIDRLGIGKIAAQRAQRNRCMAVVEERVGDAVRAARRARDDAAVRDAVARDLAVDDARQPDRDDVVGGTVADGARAGPARIAVMVAAAAGEQRQGQGERGGADGRRCGCGCVKRREHGDLVFEGFTPECRSAGRGSSGKEELAWGASSRIF